MYIVRIRCDDSLFIINNTTLEKFPDSLFYNCIVNKIDNPYMVKLSDSIYVDIKPEHLKLIIDFMRGYTLDILPTSPIYQALLLDFKKLNIPLINNPHEVTPIVYEKIIDDYIINKNSIIRPKKEKIEI